MFLPILALAVTGDDLGGEPLDKGRGKAGARGNLSVLGLRDRTVLALFGASALSLRNDDTLLKAHINL